MVLLYVPGSAITSLLPSSIVSMNNEWMGYNKINKWLRHYQPMNTIKRAKKIDEKMNIPFHLRFLL
jgi:hypothetical protein